jgi:hypothetical protein
MILRGLPLYIAVVAALPTISNAQDSPAAAPTGLSAREIFFLPGPAPAARATPAARQASSPKRMPAPAPVSSVKSNEAVPEPGNAGTAASRPARVPSSVQAPVMNASDHAARALGLRYTIEKVSGGSAEPVSIHSVFHSGDRIRISVEVNDTAYLYVISRGSSGTWSPVFPSKDVEDGSNRVEAGRKYDIPSKKGHVITFREPSGAEKLFIVASRVPEPSLERLMYAIHSGDAPSNTAPAAKPAESSENVKMLMASAQPIGDQTIGDLRAYSRDLIVEDAGAEAQQPDHSGAGQDKSFYVVNPTGSPSSRVVADITLNHQ